MVPGSTLTYGSSFWSATRSPRALNSRPSEAVVIPLPSPEATPPVTKTNFGCFCTSGGHASRGTRRDARDPSIDLDFFRGRLPAAAIRSPSEPVDPPERWNRLDGAGERERLGEDVQCDARDGRDRRRPSRKYQVERQTGGEP